MPLRLRYSSTSRFAVMSGESGERLYDLGISFIATFKLEDELAVPFVAFGLDLAAAAVPQADGSKQSGVTAGVHGNLGLHGLLNDNLYWRGQVGYIGAGVGGVTAQLTLGYVFDD